MKSLTILIVDDDEGDRKLIKRLLAKADFETTCLEAASVEESFAFDLPDVDAVFLDYLLPGESGLGHLANYRTRWPRAAIFFMTGQGDEKIAKSAIKLGATDYISKNAMNKNAITRMMKNGLEQAGAQWRLDEQRRDLATFSEVLVHDFSAPVRAAAYLSEQIEEDIESGAFQDALDGLRLLRKSTRQMQEMIKSLADHVRLDRDVELSEITAEQLLDRALVALDREIVESGADIKVDLSNAATAIWCRPPQIAQVLQNLLANGLKYSGDTAPELQLSARFDDDHHIIFEVADRGIGLPEDQLERIFEPFKRAPGAKGKSGTGLGLATCRKIISRHGGTIWCNSKEGSGTCFTFRIPTAQPQHSEDG